MGQQGQSVGLLWFIVLSVPATTYYPLQWVQANTRPPSSLWYFAERFAWAGMLAPLSLAMMLWCLARYQPQSRASRYTAIGLTALTGFVAFQAIPLLSHIMGSP